MSARWSLPPTDPPPTAGRSRRRPGRARRPEPAQSPAHRRLRRAIQHPYLVLKGRLGHPAGDPQTASARVQLPCASVWQISDAMFDIPGVRLSVGVGVLGAVAAAEGVPATVAAFRTRRQVLRGLHPEFVPALCALVGAGRDVAAGGNGICHRNSSVEAKHDRRA